MCCDSDISCISVYSSVAVSTGKESLADYILIENALPHTITTYILKQYNPLWSPVAQSAERRRRRAQYSIIRRIVITHCNTNHFVGSAA
jgi:hypothetical protein